MLQLRSSAAKQIINLKNIKKLQKQTVTFMYTVIKKFTRMLRIPGWKADFHWGINPTVLRVDNITTVKGIREESPKWLWKLVSGLGIVRLMAKGAVCKQCAPCGKSVSHAGMSEQFWNHFTCTVSNNNGHMSKWMADSGAGFFTVW